MYVQCVYMCMCICVCMCVCVCVYVCAMYVCVSTVAGIDAESATGSEIAESIVKLLNAGDDGAEGANVHLSETPALLIADLHPVITCENAKSGVEFFNNNGNLMLAPELCSAYQRISKDVVHTLEGNTGELSFDDIYNCILDHTFDAVPNFLLSLLQ